MSQNVRSVVSSLIDALSAEIKVAGKDEFRSFDIRDGAYIAALDEGYLYSFRLDQNLTLPADTPIQIRINRALTFAGSVVGYQDFHIVVSIETFLGEHIPRATLISDATFIMVALSRMLQEILKDPSPLPSVAQALLGTSQSGSESHGKLGKIVGKKMSAGKDAGLVPNACQEEAISRCGANRLHFVWGPPGTGKTATLAQTVYALVNEGERVLVLSHSNAAVDVAMLRVHDAFQSVGEAFPPGKILRVGWPFLEAARSRQEILVEGVLRFTEPRLIERKKLLEEQMRDLIASLKSSRTRESQQQVLNEVRKELLAIRNRITEARKLLISKAMVLGATMSRFTIDSQIMECAPDAVIVDETSMVSFPFIFAAAFRARVRILFFGDFRQLPPIHASTEKLVKQWMGRDAFELLGVKGSIEAGKKEPRVTLLREQYRMAPCISSVVSWLAYSGLLTDGPGVSERVAAIRDSRPWAEEELLLLDTSLLRPACLPDNKPGSFSRTNPIHSALVLSIAKKLFEDGASAAIITPYRAQSRLLVSALFQEVQSKSMSVATVHKFQGSESDVVVLDLVDSLPEKKASALTGIDQELALRLLNVAASRAKGKLLILADVGFIESYHPAMSPARKLLSLMRQFGKSIELSADLLNAELGDWPVTWFSNWADTQCSLANDIAQAQKSVTLNLYPGFIADTNLLNNIRARSQQLAFIIFSAFEQASALEDWPVDLRLMTRPGGMCALIDDDIAYIGGLSTDAAIARVSSQASLKIHREVYFGKPGTMLAPSAETSRQIDEILGTCETCRQYMRPVSVDEKWWLACKAGHCKRLLDRSSLQTLLETLKLTCGCGGSLRAVQAGEAIFIGCSNFADTCDSDPPTVRELFGI